MSSGWLEWKNLFQKVLFYFFKELSQTLDSVLKDRQTICLQQVPGKAVHFLCLLFHFLFIFLNHSFIQ